MTTTDPQTTDPRPHYDRALEWVRKLMAAARPDQLGDPTPCPEFDVRTLLGHLVATVDRLRVIGTGSDPFSTPTIVTGVPDDGWVDALGAAAERMWAIWSDDTRLDAPVIVPWGTVPGRAAMWGYLGEALVHGWDLAIATGQDPEAAPELALAALTWSRDKIPTDREDIPFDAVVESAADAGPTEQLANWSGRQSRHAAAAQR